LRLLYRHTNQLVLPVSLLIAITLYFTSAVVAETVFDNSDYSENLRVAAISLPFMAILMINVEYIRGLKLLLFSEYLRSVNRPLINIVLLLTLASSFTSTILPIYTLAAAVIITSLFSFIFVLNKVVKLPVDNTSNFSMNELLHTSMPMMVTSLASFLIGNISIYFLEFFHSTTEVGAFSVAQKIALLVSLILTVVNTISAPKFSELFWAKKYKPLQVLVHQSSKVIFAISLCASALLALFSESILALFGEDFVIARSALLMLVLGQMVNAMTGSVGIFMNMTGSQSVLRNIVVVVSLLSVLGNLIIIPEYGINGAAFVVMMAAIIMNVVLAVYAQWKLGFITYYFPLLSRCE
jgi:O-antigen/teichoic acid export membrane protein